MQIYHDSRKYKNIEESENILILKHTQIQGCFKASIALILFAGFTVNIWLIKFLASAVTVSHSGDGYLKWEEKIEKEGY